MKINRFFDSFGKEWELRIKDSDNPVKNQIITSILTELNDDTIFFDKSIEKEGRQ